MTIALGPLLGIIGGILLTLSYAPYIYHILKRKTQPHIYTWILWTLTQTMATFAVIEGSGGFFSALSIGSGVILSLVVLLLSFRYGTGNITRFDTIALITGLCAFVIWWQFNHPIIAVILISTIEAIGFLPTYRKTWSNPWSESLMAWVLFILGNICTLLALEHYNLLTTTYIATVTVASIFLIFLSKKRRAEIK